MIEKLTTEPLSSIPMIFGIVIVIAGLILLVLPPKKPNYIYGYRTKRSMKDLQHWKFAQQYSAKLMLLFGLASMSFSSVGFIFSFSLGVELTIGILWIILLSFLLILRVEKAIVNKFGE